MCLFRPCFSNCNNVTLRLSPLFQCCPSIRIHLPCNQPVTWHHSNPLKKWAGPPHAQTLPPMDSTLQIRVKDTFQLQKDGAYLQLLRDSNNGLVETIYSHFMMEILLIEFQWIQNFQIQIVLKDSFMIERSRIYFWMIFTIKSDNCWDMDNVILSSSTKVWFWVGFSGLLKWRFLMKEKMGSRDKIWI